LKSEIDIYVIDRVRELRVKRNLSQADLAYDLNVSVGFIGKVESANYSTHYNIRHLNELAKILSCSPQDFLPIKPI
jgi:transcriptional regulator with XRE-family HTH domain